jgi:hypothetical protein
MNTANLFCTLSSSCIAHLIDSAQQIICYAGPGIQVEPAQAMVEVANRLGPEMLTVCVDFDEEKKLWGQVFQYHILP